MVSLFTVSLSRSVDLARKKCILTVLVCFDQNPIQIIFTDISDISITIGENGWSLLVSGLKIFVWSHHHAGVSKVGILHNFAFF